DDYAGKRIRCGGCQSVATVPMTSEAVREPPPLRERPPERDYSDEPPRRRRDRYNDDYDDRPRPSLRRRRQWADCPNCGAHDPAKVSYTWWGGFIGPAIINVVRCQECGTQYNGIHGDYNTTRILIYTGVGIGIGLAFAVCVGLMGLL